MPVAQIYEEEFRTQESEFNMNSVQLDDEYWFKTSSLVGEIKIKLPSSFKLHPFMGGVF